MGVRSGRRAFTGSDGASVSETVACMRDTQGYEQPASRHGFHPHGARNGSRADAGESQEGLRGEKREAEGRSMATISSERRFFLREGARGVTRASLVAMLAFGGASLPLAGCSAPGGGSAGADATSSERRELSEEEVEQMLDSDLSVAPIDEEQVPDECVKRAREALSGNGDSGDEEASEEEVLHAGMMLHHLEKKYDLPFKVTSITPPMNDGNRYTWMGFLECEDDEYAYSGDEVSQVPGREEGQGRSVVCYIHEGGEHPVLSDDFVLQVRRDDVLSSLTDATRKVLDEHGVSVIDLGCVVPVKFKDSCLGKADKLTVDSKASEIIPLLDFDSVGMALVELPDGKSPREVAEDLAGDVREAYGDLGISDDEREDGESKGGSQWALSLVFNGNVTEDPVLSITADGIVGAMEASPSTS